MTLWYSDGSAEDVYDLSCDYKGKLKAGEQTLYFRYENLVYPYYINVKTKNGETVTTVSTDATQAPQNSGPLQAAHMPQVLL